MSIQEKVARLMSRHNGKPVLRPTRPLILSDELPPRKPSKGEATCVNEMLLMMACWKRNDFVEGFCSRELQTFFTCTQEEQKKKGKEKGRLSSKESSALLKRFPSIKTEI